MTSERKKRRWWIWVPAGVGVFLLLVVAGGFVVLDRYATDIVIGALRDAALPEPRLQVLSVGLSESHLGEVRLGPDDVLTAESIVLEYDLFDLLDLDTGDLTVRLVRPVLQLSVDETGAISLGSLDPLLAGSSEGGGGPAFGSVVLEDALLQIATPHGPVEATLDGSIENLGDDALRIDAAIRAGGDLGSVAGTIAATLGPDGAIDGEGSVSRLELDTPWASAAGGSGRFALHHSPGEALPGGSLDLTFDRLTVAPDLLPPQLQADGAGLQLESVSLDARLAGPSLSLALAAADPAGDNAVSLELAYPDALAGGEATLTVDISTAGDQLLWLWREDWVGGGGLTASVMAAATLPPLMEMLSAPDAAAALSTGRLAAQWIMSDAVFPGIARGVSAVGEVEVALQDGVATLTAAAPLELRVERLDPALIAAAVEADPAWAPILARQFAGHIDMAIEGRGDRPLSITLARPDGRWTMRGDATALVATQDGPIAAVEMTGNATLGEDPAVVIDDISVYAADIETPAASVGVLEAAGRFTWQNGAPAFDLAGAASELSFTDPQLSFPRLALEVAMAPDPAATDGDGLVGPVAASFADSGGAIEEVAMTGLSGDLSGRLQWDDGVARLSFTSDAVFRVESMDIDGDVLIPEPAIVRVLASENPVLELDLSDPASWSLRHSLSVGPLDIQGSIRLGDERVRTAIRTESLQMEGGYVDGGYVMRIDIAGVTGSAPQRGWAIAGATVGIEYDDDDTQNLITIEAAASQLSMTETAGIFSRIGMRGRMDYGLDDVIGFSVRLFDERNLLIADVDARHVLDNNTGSATVEVQDLIFNPVVLQPGDISPLLDAFENVTGTVDVAGSVRWSEAGITPDLALLISDMSGSYDDVEFTRMNTVIELSSLSPFETAPGQLLSIATIDPGMPISDATVTFAVTGGDTLVIEQATLELAGGVVTTADQAIAFVAQEQQLQLTVTGVDLDTLLAFADLENLEAEGTLDGGIPIVIVNGDVVIPEAWLSAREPGFIRYDSSGDLGAVRGSNQGVDLMIELLENFLYDELDLRLMRPVAGSMEVSFRILGRNPEVYGGVPIDLTLNVDGELEDVIRNSLEIYRVPETIQDLIMEYGFETATPTN